MKDLKKLWIGLALFAVLSPIGLVASGDAWGEWGSKSFKEMLGFIPQGLAKFTDIWQAPLGGYTVPWAGSYIGYIISAFAGILLVVLVTWLLGKFFARQEKDNQECKNE